MGQTNEPRASKPLPERIAQQIREAIVDARLSFGEALSEENLAAAFEVSRTPVREALDQLQREGLVKIVPKSGTYVFTPTLADIAALCEYRAGLELQAVELAAARNGDALRRRLTDLADGMAKVIKSGDMCGYGRLDTQYHLAFLEGSENRYLQQGYTLILGQVSALRTALAVHTEAEPARSFADHRLIIDLLAQGNLRRLRTVLRAHILRTEKNYVSAFRDLASAEPRVDRLRRRLKSS
jgi:DNA-binding GntR family transcriptional regulator